MVSHHQRAPPPPAAVAASVAGSAPPAPRATSVSSARSHTRRHRHSRSHHGGLSGHAAQNDFPVFSHTGDVEIIVSSADGRRENRYLLHRLILCQCSGFFEAGTRSEWSGQRGTTTTTGLGRISERDGSPENGSSTTASRDGRLSQDQGGRRRWRYVLDWEGMDDGDTPILVQKDRDPPSIFGDGHHSRATSTRHKPPPANEGFFRSMTNFSTQNNRTERPVTTSTLSDPPGDDLLQHYDNLFRMCYQYHPILDNVNIATAYTQCKALLNLADMYDALDIVDSRVDHHLLRFGTRLFKQVAKYPPSYLRLGYLARSITIFTEALVHVVGQWPLAAPQLQHNLDPPVLHLIQHKAAALATARARVDATLWHLHLSSPRSNSTDPITPNSDILGWLATSLFRQWLADHLPTPTSASPTGRPYRLLHAQSSVLPHDACKRFLKLFPDLYTRDTLRRFERRVDELCRLARDAVRPLLWNGLEVDPAGLAGPGGWGYLTCVRLEEGEVPWEE